jgi:hypothetical protein
VEVTAESYCRELEAYLCRKNDGHLVRIVGPAFEQVCGWAARGVPLALAQRGIDRYFARYYAKGPRRRPVRIEFCEADVLDMFDEWRRAVGVPAVQTSDDAPAAGTGERAAEDGTEDGTEEEISSRHGSLPAHLERVVARLTVLRAGEDRRLDTVLDAIVRELDSVRVTAKRLRGPARHAFLQRLAELDRTLIDAARAQCDAATLQRLVAAADAELAPFRSRMTPEAFEQSRIVCLDRCLRDHLRLPVVSYE